jgi:hypothetical protein
VQLEDAVIKRLILGGLVIGAVATLVRKRIGRSGYDSDEIDSADYGEFGHRGAPAPEQHAAPAETRHDTTPEKLSMEARIATALPAIRAAWPEVSEDEIRAAKDDLNRLAQVIGEKTGSPTTEVRRRLDEIIAAEAPDPSYPGR